MARFGFIGLLVTLLIAGVAGVIGYNWGYSAGLVNTAAANGSAVVYAPGYGWGGGFSFFGLLFGLFFLFLIFGLIRRAFFGWGGGRGGHPMHGYGYGRGWGKGGWGGSGDADPSNASGNPPVPPFVEGMLRDWHRQAHDTSASGTGGTGSAGSSTNTPSSSGPTPA